MISALAQVAQEVAKQSSYINIAIPTALVSSTLALLGREGIAAIVNRRQKKNGNGKDKPGMGAECLKHRDELTALKTEQANTKEDIIEIKLDVKELLRRVRPK
jgi:hypothetical protein